MGALIFPSIPFVRMSVDVLTLESGIPLKFMTLLILMRISFQLTFFRNYLNYVLDISHQPFSDDKKEVSIPCQNSGQKVT